MTILRDDLAAGLVDLSDVSDPAAEPLAAVHPGEILHDDFLEPHGLDARTLAGHLRVSVAELEGIVRGQRSVSVEMALRLSRYFGTTAEFWVRLQAQYDLEVTRHRVGRQVERDISPRVP